MGECTRESLDCERKTALPMRWAGAPGELVGVGKLPMVADARRASRGFEEGTSSEEPTKNGAEGVRTYSLPVHGVDREFASIGIDGPLRLCSWRFRRFPLWRLVMYSAWNAAPIPYRSSVPGHSWQSSLLDTSTTRGRKRRDRQSPSRSTCWLQVTSSRSEPRGRQRPMGSGPRVSLPGRAG